MAQALKGSVRNQERRRLAWMLSSLLLIWALWVLPPRWYPSQANNLGVEDLVFVLTGILLGVGRQGIDLLGLRLFVASLALLAAAPARCNGLGDCFTAYEIGVPIVGLFGSLLFGLIAIPTNVAWNRGLRNLAPEFRWSRLSTVKRWQWILLGIGAIGGAMAYYVSLGIPAY